MPNFIRACAVAAVLAAVLLCSTQSQASTLQFTLSGDHNITWFLDSDPSPAGSDASRTWFANVPGTAANFLVFWGAVQGGGFTITDDVTNGPIFLDYAGDQIFSGTKAVPHFSPGLYDITFNFISDQAVHDTLRVSEMPIPGGLPLMVTALAGLGFVGWRHQARRRL